jgi:hypothetical protein
MAAIAIRSRRQSGCWSKRRIGPAGPNGRSRQTGMDGRSSPGAWSIPNARDPIDTCLGGIRKLNLIGAWWPFITTAGAEGLARLHREESVRKLDFQHAFDFFHLGLCFGKQIGQVVGTEF